MPRTVNVLSRTTLVTLAALVTALVIILAQSPLWLDAVPLTFKVIVVSVAVLSFFRPQDGLLVVAGLSAIGLVAGRLIDSVARGSEPLVLAFLVGWFLGVWRPRDRRQWSFTSLHLPVVLFGLVPTVNIESDDRQCLGAGWGVSEHRPAGDFRWIIGTTGEVWLPLRHLRDHRLTLSGWPLGGDEVQRLRVLVNGELLVETVVMQGEGSWVFRVGEDVLRRGLNQVRLHLAWANPPSDADRRALSAAFS